MTCPRPIGVQARPLTRLVLHQVDLDGQAIADRARGRHTLDEQADAGGVAVGDRPSGDGHHAFKPGWEGALGPEQLLHPGEPLNGFLR